MGTYASKCFVYYGPGDVRLETLEITCGPTDIILRIEVCGRCHTRGTSAPNGTYGYPYDDANNVMFIPGDNLADYFIEMQ